MVEAQRLNVKGAFDAYVRNSSLPTEGIARAPLQFPVSSRNC